MDPFSDQGLTALKFDLKLIGVTRGSDGKMAIVPSVRMIATILFRASQTLGAINPFLGALVKQVNHVITGADIAWQAKIGPGVQLQHPTGVTIGPQAQIGHSVVVEQGITIGVLDGADQSAMAVIGEGVLIGAGARVFGPVEIGPGAKIGANAVVFKDVPAGATAVGVPARIIPPRE